MGAKMKLVLRTKNNDNPKTYILARGLDQLDPLAFERMVEQFKLAAHEYVIGWDVEEESNFQ